MEQAIIYVAIAFVALCLWLVARNDLVRLNGIARQVRGEVIGHHSSTTKFVIVNLGDVIMATQISCSSPHSVC